MLVLGVTGSTGLPALSLHDALPICRGGAAQRDEGGVDAVDERGLVEQVAGVVAGDLLDEPAFIDRIDRSEEHTSELQSHSDLVCRLLLEKKKKYKRNCKQSTLSASA